MMNSRTLNVTCRQPFTNSYHYINNLHKAKQKSKSCALHDYIKKFIIGISILLLLLTIWGIGRAEANDQAFHTVKYFKSIMVEEGDTLWKLSDKYMTNEYSSKNAYINEIIHINNLENDTIHTGQYIMVPYYTEVDN